MTCSSLSTRAPPSDRQQCKQIRLRRLESTVAKLLAGKDTMPSCMARDCMLQGGDETVGRALTLCQEWGVAPVFPSTKSGAAKWKSRISKAAMAQKQSRLDAYMSLDSQPGRRSDCIMLETMAGELDHVQAWVALGLKDWQIELLTRYKLGGFKNSKVAAARAPQVLKAPT